MKKTVVCGFLLLTLLLTACQGNTAEPNDISAERSPADVTTEESTEPETKESFMNVKYVVGSISGSQGTDISHTGRFKTLDYIALSDIEAISITGKYCLAWFAYDKSYTYLGNGSNIYPTLPNEGVWLAEGQDVTKADILKWNENAVYLRFAVKRASGDISLESDVSASRIKIYVSGYPGDEDYVSPGLNKVASVAGSRQDGAIYGGYLFSFNKAGICKVYSVDTYKHVSDFTLDKINVITPHSNSVCFSSLKYDESDEFPLLYCNVYNNYKNDRSYDGTCAVYRIQRNGTSFTSTLVQVIKIGFTNDTQRWSSPDGDTRPFGNFVVDTDNNRLYAFTMRDASKTTRFFSFTLPAVNDGVLDSSLGVKKVTLEVDDIIDTFDTEYFNYLQGATYYNGKIYSLEGFTDDTTNKATLRVVDTATKSICEKIDLYGLNLKAEPETVFVLNDTGYYIDISGNVYEFPIK